MSKIVFKTSDGNDIYVSDYTENGTSYLILGQEVLEIDGTVDFTITVDVRMTKDDVIRLANVLRNWAYTGELTAGNEETQNGD